MHNGRTEVPITSVQLSWWVDMCVCVCPCVRACVRAHVSARARVCVCVCGRVHAYKYNIVMYACDCRCTAGFTVWSQSVREKINVLTSCFSSEARISGWFFSVGIISPLDDLHVSDTIFFFLTCSRRPLPRFENWVCLHSSTSSHQARRNGCLSSQSRARVTIHHRGHWERGRRSAPAPAFRTGATSRPSPSTHCMETTHYRWDIRGGKFPCQLESYADKLWCSNCGVEHTNFIYLLLNAYCSLPAVSRIPAGEILPDLMDCLVCPLAQYNNIGSIEMTSPVNSSSERIFKGNKLVG